MAERITDQHIYDALLELKQQVKELNGCVKENTTAIAVLESQQSHHSINWDRIIQLGLAIAQAFILWKLFGTPQPMRVVTHHIRRDDQLSEDDAVGG